MTRAYDQFCPVATGLDEVGDRWTLLILRDLVWYGSARFRDFVTNNPGIPPALLTERLKMLMGRGHVTKAGPHYSVNDPDGDLRQLIDTLTTLGTRILEEQGPTVGSIQKLAQRMTVTRASELSALETMDLTISVGTMTTGIQVGQGSITVTTPQKSAPHVVATPKEFAQLVAGHLDPEQISISHDRRRVGERLRLLRPVA